MQRLILQPIPNIEIHRVASETKYANQQSDRHTALIMHSLRVRCVNNALKLHDLLSALKEMSG